MIGNVVDVMIDLGYGVLWLIFDVIAVIALFVKFSWIELGGVVLISYFVWRNVNNALTSAARKAHKPQREQPEIAPERADPVQIQRMSPVS